MKMLKSLAVVLLGLVVTNAVRAVDTYQLDPAHTTIGFSINHMVINEVHGRFKDFTGTIIIDPQATNAIVSVKGDIQAASIDTGIAKRDEHLRSADFFNVEKFPTITFASQRINRDGKQQLVSGDFTMHGVTKEISCPVTLKGPIKDPWGGTRVGLKVKLTIDRKDYGLTWNKVIEAGGLLVGDEVEITIDAEAIKQQPAK